MEEPGFDTVEIRVSQFERQKHISSKQPNRILKEAGLAATVHVLIRDMNIASVNNGIRREAVRQMIEAVNFCAEIEGLLVVVHPGKRSSKLEDIEEQWKHQIDSLEKIHKTAAAKDAMVTVEIMEWEKAEKLVRTAEDIRRLQASLPEFCLPVTLDTTARFPHQETLFPPSSYFWILLQAHCYVCL